MNYLELIESKAAEKMKSLIENSLSELISFNDIEDIPKERGVYFIYDGTELVYIGMAGAGEKQKIRQRCRQNINESTGGTFRNKVMKYKNLSMQKAITYIKANCYVRYIVEEEFKKMEHIAIGLFKPKYND